MTGPEDPRDPEDREQQASVTRLLLYYLNGPLAEGWRLRGVLPAPGAVRIAVLAEGDGSDGGEGEAVTFLYEFPHDTVAPYYIPGILRTVLTGTRFYSSSEVGEVMGMTLIRLRPGEITPDPEPEAGLALTVLRSLSEPGDDEHPFLVGFLILDPTRMRLYVQRPDGPGIAGADIRFTDASTALIGSVPSLLGEKQYRRPSPGDPHCDYVVDLTGW
ncbi:hypothetical protein ABZX40_37965 [Streptomyces sp. NPDC004610]|uniref:hypothetical protein n=1 Tax=unclassified Streptomyces TaxID=2593676 RepID=UPI0033B524CA